MRIQVVFQDRPAIVHNGRWTARGWPGLEAMLNAWTANVPFLATACGPDPDKYLARAAARKFGGEILTPIPPAEPEPVEIVR